MKIAISELKLDPDNVRSHNQRNIEAIKRSLARFGQQKPIVVDRRGVVVAGNGTLLAAQALGWSEIDALCTELEADEARAYAIADNRLTDLSDFDPNKLSAAISDFTDDLLAAIGFDGAELEEMSAEPGPPGQSRVNPGPDRPIMVRIMIAVSNVEEVERALTQTGQVNREEALLEVCRGYAKRQLDG
jgi:hypothetical protein